MDRNFCQACGSRTCVKKIAVSTSTVDHAEIAKRFQEFTDVFKGKPYQRQKSALEQQPLDFLATVSPPKDTSSCTSDDIIRFLITETSKEGRCYIVNLVLKLIVIVRLA